MSTTWIFAITEFLLIFWGYDSGTDFGMLGLKLCKPHFPFASRCPVRISPWRQQSETGNLPDIFPYAHYSCFRFLFFLCSSLYFVPMVMLILLRSFSITHSASLRAPSAPSSERHQNHPTKQSPSSEVRVSFLRALLRSFLSFNIPILLFLFLQSQNLQLFSAFTASVIPQSSLLASLVLQCIANSSFIEFSPQACLARFLSPKWTLIGIVVVFLKQKNKKHVFQICLLKYLQMEGYDSRTLIKIITSEGGRGQLGTARSATCW